MRGMSFTGLLLAALIFPLVPARADPPCVHLPAFDSGWVDMGQAQGKGVYHYLGGDKADYQGYLECRDTVYKTPHNLYLGTINFHANPPTGFSSGDRVGAYWSGLTDTFVTLYRAAEDTFCPQARFRIWRAPQADYDSGVLTPAQGTTLTLTHNLGGSVGDYFVSLVFGGEVGGTCFLGGNHQVNNDRQGGWWSNLTSTSIKVRRLEEDSMASWGLRVRIYRLPPPAYDSGWHSVTAGQIKTLNHNLGVGTRDMVVILDQFTSSSDLGINQCYAGGAHMGTQPPSGLSNGDRVGAAWKSLTPDSIQVYRLEEDIYAYSVRFRIYLAEAFNLPFLVNTLLPGR